MSSYGLLSRDFLGSSSVKTPILFSDLLIIYIQVLPNSEEHELPVAVVNQFNKTVLTVLTCGPVVENNL